MTQQVMSTFFNHQPTWFYCQVQLDYSFWWHPAAQRSGIGFPLGHYWCMSYAHCVGQGQGMQMISGSTYCAIAAALRLWQKVGGYISYTLLAGPSGYH